ncbi:MAG: hypothetical protein WD535_00315 [Thermaerobacterales bacterium]
MVLGFLRSKKAPALPEVSRDDLENKILPAEGPVLVELWTAESDSETFTRAVNNVHRERPDDFRLVRVRLSDLVDLINEHRTNKFYNAYNFDQLPALALFREGRLVTTFNPAQPHPDAVIWQNDIERQFRRFLAIFLDFDPEKVTYNHKK